MPSSADPTLCLPRPEHDPEQEMLALAEQTLHIINVATALAGSARPVDLDGLQAQVGLLCAKALDLPPGKTGFAKLELRRLVRSLDALEETMRSEFA
jgi:hypothetical protein